VNSIFRIFGFAGLLFVSALSTVAATQPNIVVILSDDMGFSDLGCLWRRNPDA